MDANKYTVISECRQYGWKKHIFPIMVAQVKDFDEISIGMKNKSNYRGTSFLFNMLSKIGYNLIW